MPTRTSCLFHFTKELATLQTILSGGYFWPKYSLEDLTWLVPKIAHLAFPMVSFCDIPITRIDEHSDYYGSYGIALSQEWGTKSGVNPLLYLNDKSPLAKDLKITCATLMANDTSDNRAGMAQSLRLLAYIKPIVGIMRKNGVNEVKDFYEESEWRYVPSTVIKTFEDVLSQSQFDDPDVRTTADDNSLKAGALTFSITDIRYLFVKTVSEIPLIVDYINSNLGHYPANHLKILSSRIISLEDFYRDL